MPKDREKATSKPDFQIILASSSPRRKEILNQLIKVFKVVNPDVEELKNHNEGPASLVLENAKVKCLKVADSFPSCWVLGADTTVALGAEVFGKPRDLVDAKSMLLSLSGKIHHVYTGICLCNLSKEIFLNETVTTSVTFKKIDESDVDNYFRKVNPLDKAGAYAIQTSSEMIVDSYVGSLTNVIGLPREHLHKWLQSFNLL